MDNQRATWTPSSVRRNCDFCVTKKVKCPGDQDGNGCLFCRKKGVRCIYSAKQKPGPKGRKREVQDLGSATEASSAPKDSSAPQMQQQHPLATGVAGSKGDSHAGAGDGYASGVGGESGSPLMASSPPSIPPMRPSKRLKTTHDEGYRSARQQAEGERKRKNIPLQPKPTSLTQWLCGSGEDDSRPASVHSGREAPLNPPLIYGFSPSSWTSVAHRAPGGDSLGRARLDSSTGTFGAQRAFSGDAHTLKTAIEPGGNFDEAGCRRAGSMHAEDRSGNGGSFVSGFTGKGPILEELLDLLNPLDSLIDEHISGGSDASSTSSDADDDEMARISAYWKKQKSAAGGRRETMPVIGVDQGVGSRQNESLSGGAPRGGGNASGRGVRNDVSLDVSEVVLTFGESLLPELGSENSEGFRGGAVKESYPEYPPNRRLPLASDAPVDSSSDQRAISANTGIGFATNSKRGSSADQLDGGSSEGYSSPLDPFAYDFSQGQLSLGDRSSMGNVTRDGSESVLTFGESLLPEPGSENSEGFRGGAVRESYPGHPSPTAAFPLASDAPVDSASEQRAISANTSIGFATNSNRGSSADQLDGGSSEGHSSPFDPFAYDFSQGQISLGDRSSMGNVTRNVSESVLTFGESLLPELGSENGEGFRGGAVKGSYPEHPPTAAFPLASDAPVDSASEQRAISANTGIVFGTNSKRGSSADQLDGGSSEGYSSPLDPFAYDFSQGQLSLGDRSSMGNVTRDVFESVLTFGESLLPELGSENGEGFRGGAVRESYPGHPPNRSLPLASDSPAGSASEQRAISANTDIGFATNSNRGSSADQLDGGSSEGHSSPLDPFAYDFSQGQLSLGDRSCMGNVMNEYIDFLGGSSGEPPVSDADIDAGSDYHV